MSLSTARARERYLFPLIFTPGFFITQSAFLKSSSRCAPRIYVRCDKSRVLSEFSESIVGFSCSSVFISVTVTNAPCFRKKRTHASPPPFSPSPITVTCFPAMSSIVLNVQPCEYVCIVSSAFSANRYLLVWSFDFSEWRETASSIRRLVSCGKSSPASPHIFGNILIGVKPGIVFISLK